MSTTTEEKRFTPILERILLVQRVCKFFCDTPKSVVVARCVTSSWEDMIVCYPSTVVARACVCRDTASANGKISKNKTNAAARNRDCTRAWFNVVCRLIKITSDFETTLVPFLRGAVDAATLAVKQQEQAASSPSDEEEEDDDDDDGDAAAACPPPAGTTTTAAADAVLRAFLDHRYGHRAVRLTHLAAANSTRCPKLLEYLVIVLPAGAFLPYGPPATSYYQSRRAFRHGRTVLHDACESGNADAIRFLLGNDNGDGDDNDDDDDDDNAHAGGHNFHRVDIAFMNHFRSPAHRRSNDKYDDPALILIHYIAMSSRKLPPALHLACENNHLECVRLMLDLGGRGSGSGGGLHPITVRARATGETALHLACRTCNEPLLKLLLEWARANAASEREFEEFLEMRDCGQHRMPAVATAILSGAPFEMVELLMDAMKLSTSNSRIRSEKEAEKRGRCAAHWETLRFHRNGHGLVHLAVKANRPDLVRYFLRQQPSELNRQQRRRHSMLQTPLHLAVLAKNTEMIDLLLSWSATTDEGDTVTADFEVRNTFDCTPLTAAIVKWSHPTVEDGSDVAYIKELQQRGARLDYATFVMTREQPSPADRGSSLLYEMCVAMRRVPSLKMLRYIIERCNVVDESDGGGDGGAKTTNIVTRRGRYGHTMVHAFVRNEMRTSLHPRSLRYLETVVGASGCPTEFVNDAPIVNGKPRFSPLSFALLSVQWFQSNSDAKAIVRYLLSQGADTTAPVQRLMETATIKTCADAIESLGLQ